MNAGVFASVMNQGRYNSNAGAIRQAAWDAIVALADYGHGVMSATSGGGGCYKETSVTNLCANGDECMGLKAFGNLQPTALKLIYKGNLALTPSNALIWWKDFGNTTSLAPLYIDRGGGDKYLRMLNGPVNTSYYETDPGSISPNVVHPVDFIMAFRYVPHTPDEGVNRIKTLGSTVATERISAIDGYTPNLTTANGVTYNYYIDNILRVLVRADGTWQIWVNGVSKATGTGGTFSTNEWIWGTSSHVQQCHMRYNLVKFGEFSSTDIASIYANSQTIWPWQKPSYPFLTEVYYGDNSTFDGTAKAWTVGLGKTPVFTGGTGTAGTHKYLWYWFDSIDTTLFPSADGVLTNVRQIPCSANISTMVAGNSVTQMSIDGFNLMSGAVSFATSATATADAIVSNINANQTKFLAQRRATATILLHPKGVGCNAYATNAITITASGFSPTKLDAPRGITLSRPAYAVTGQVFDGHQGDNIMKVMWVVIPVDSNGVEGEALPSRAIPDNIA